MLEVGSFGRLPVELPTRRTCLKPVSCVRYLNDFSLEFECWHSKRVSYSNTTFIKWCSVILFLHKSKCWYSKKVWNPVQVSGGWHFKQSAKSWQSLQFFVKRLTGKQRKQRKREEEVRIDGSACRVESSLPKMVSYCSRTGTFLLCVMLSVWKLTDIVTVCFRT